MNIACLTHNAGEGIMQPVTGIRRMQSGIKILFLAFSIAMCKF
jgi:hypothetical protein